MLLPRGFAVGASVERNVHPCRARDGVEVVRTDPVVGRGSAHGETARHRDQQAALDFGPIVCRADPRAIDEKSSLSKFQIPSMPT